MSGSSQGCGCARPRAEDERRRVATTGLPPHPLDDLGGDAAVLLDVGAAVRAASLVHRQRDRVGDERQVGALAHVVGQLGQRRQGRVDHGLHSRGG